MKNQLLAQTEQKIESSLLGKTKTDYDKVVVAGMKAALHGGPNSILAKLKDSKNPIHDCVVGALNLAIILRKQSRNTMPLNAMIPAATTLMLHAMDFAEELGIVHIDKPELDQATHLLVNTLFKRLGITPPMLHTAVGRVRALIENSVSVERLKYAAGITKDPRTPEPTLSPDNNERGQETA